MRTVGSKYSLRRLVQTGITDAPVRQRDRFRLADCDHVVLTTRLIGWICLTSTSAHFLPVVFTSESTFCSALAIVFSEKIVNMTLPGKKHAHRYGTKKQSMRKKLQLARAAKEKGGKCDADSGGIVAPGAEPAWPHVSGDSVPAASLQEVIIRYFTVIILPINVATIIEF